MILKYFSPNTILSITKGYYLLLLTPHIFYIFIGNSAYGSMLINRTTHKNVSYVDSYTDAQFLINKHSFTKCKSLKNDTYEIESSKDSFNMDLPIQIGWLILGYAKLKLLSFKYDFLDQYVDRSKYMLAECDTDSLYFGIAGDTLRSVIKDDRIQQYDMQLNNLCGDDEATLEKIKWLPRECCQRHKQLDRRTPGLFKVSISKYLIISIYYILL